MTPFQDYPRMMFHRSGLTCVVLSRDEEDGLGADWRRTVWLPADVAMPVESAPEPPRVAVPGPMCWHKRIGLDGICLDCGQRAAIQLPDPEDNGDPWDAPHPSWAPDESAAFDPARKKAARKRR